MDIQIYTDLNNEDYIFIDLASLMHAYEYATQIGNKDIAETLKSLFQDGTEKTRIEKTSAVYLFLKTCPNVKLDDINLEMIQQAYLVARYQNNAVVLRSLGKILGRWQNYVLEDNELEGLTKEVLALPEDIRNYILNHHDASFYEEQIREKAKTVKKQEEDQRLVQITGTEKIYKKTA